MVLPLLTPPVIFGGAAIANVTAHLPWTTAVSLLAGYALACFAVMVVAISVMLTWIRLKSDSVWPCAILHASHNLFIQGFFTPLTAPRGGVTPYAIDEFGWAVPTLTVVFALGFWLVRGKALGKAVSPLHPATT